MTTGKKVVYEGQVQGVGFRRRTELLAARFDVAGYVKNLADGRVELVVTGMADEIERFLEQIRQRLGAHIEREDGETVETAAFSGFGIRRD